MLSISHNTILRLEYHAKEKTNGSKRDVQVIDDTANNGDPIYYNTSLPLQHTPDTEGILVNGFVTTLTKIKASGALQLEYSVCFFFFLC